LSAVARQAASVATLVEVARTEAEAASQERLEATAARLVPAMDMEAMVEEDMVVEAKVAEAKTEEQMVEEVMGMDFLEEVVGAQGFRRALLEGTWVADLREAGEMAVEATAEGSMEEAMAEEVMAAAVAPR